MLVFFQEVAMTPKEKVEMIKAISKLILAVATLIASITGLVAVLV